MQNISILQYIVDEISVTKNFVQDCIQWYRKNSKLPANRKYMSDGSENEFHDTSYIYKALCKILVACNV